MTNLGVMQPITASVFGPGLGPESKSWAERFMTGFSPEERLPGPVMEICHEHQCVCRGCGCGF
jgi:hypothetical protein